MLILLRCNEPNCSLTYDIEKDRLTLFIPAIDPARVIWYGRGSTPEEAMDKYDIDDVRYILDLDCALYEYMGSDRGKVYVLDAFENQYRFYGGHPDVGRQLDCTLLRPVMNLARMVKDQHEIGLIRKANEISSRAHREVLAKTRDFQNEAEVEGLFLNVCISHQAKEQAYDVIAASGPNAGTLHYDSNNEDFENRQLMCLDAGCEWQLYASDITRTFPLSGEWSSKEAENIYHLVEKMQESCIERLGPGVRYLDLHIKAHQIAIDGLLALGILHNGTKEEIYKAGTSRAFFPHGLGHHVGLEVHDVGQSELMSYQSNGVKITGEELYGKVCLTLPIYSSVIYAKSPQPYSLFPEQYHHPVYERSMCLAPTDPSSPALHEGMVVTVEPGIYFSRYALEKFYLPHPDHSKYINVAVLNKYYPVGGVRIEDDVLITAKGYEVLTTAPKGADMLDIIQSGDPEADLDGRRSRESSETLSGEKEQDNAAVFRAPGISRENSWKFAKACAEREATPAQCLRDTKSCAEPTKPATLPRGFGPHAGQKSNIASEPTQKATAPSASAQEEVKLLPRADHPPWKGITVESHGCNYMRRSKEMSMAPLTKQLSTSPPCLEEPAYLGQCPGIKEQERVFGKLQEVFPASHRSSLRGLRSEEPAEPAPVLENRSREMSHFPQVHRSFEKRSSSKPGNPSSGSNMVTLHELQDKFDRGIKEARERFLARRSKRHQIGSGTVPLEVVLKRLAALEFGILNRFLTRQAEEDKAHLSFLGSAQVQRLIDVSPALREYEMQLRLLEQQDSECQMQLMMIEQKNDKRSIEEKEALKESSGGLIDPRGRAENYHVSTQIEEMEKLFSSAGIDPKSLIATAAREQLSKVRSPTTTEGDHAPQDIETKFNLLKQRVQEHERQSEVLSRQSWRDINVRNAGATSREEDFKVHRSASTSQKKLKVKLPPLVPPPRNVVEDASGSKSEGRFSGSSQPAPPRGDYQMQLMQLEQANRKRLLLARQEEDAKAHAQKIFEAMQQNTTRRLGDRMTKELLADELTKEEFQHIQRTSSQQDYTFQLLLLELRTKQRLDLEKQEQQAIAKEHEHAMAMLQNETLNIGDEPLSHTQEVCHKNCPQIDYSFHLMLMARRCAQRQHLAAEANAKTHEHVMALLQERSGELPYKTTGHDPRQCQKLCSQRDFSLHLGLLERWNKERLRRETRGRESKAQKPDEESLSLHTEQVKEETTPVATEGKTDDAAGESRSEESKDLRKHRQQQGFEAQLKILEQSCRRRLLLARQEQESEPQKSTEASPFLLSEQAKEEKSDDAAGEPRSEESEDLRKQRQQQNYEAQLKILEQMGQRRLLLAGQSEVPPVGSAPPCPGSSIPTPEPDPKAQNPNQKQAPESDLAIPTAKLVDLLNDCLPRHDSMTKWRPMQRMQPMPGVWVDAPKSAPVPISPPPQGQNGPAGYPIAFPRPTCSNGHPAVYECHVGRCPMRGEFGPLPGMEH